MMTDAELERFAPWVNWREPVKIRILEAGRTDWGCRLCVGRHGLDAHKLVDHPKTQQEYDEHMKKEHAT